MEAGGIEPPTPPCKGGVVPLSPRPRETRRGERGEVAGSIASLAPLCSSVRRLTPLAKGVDMSAARCLGIALLVIAGVVASVATAQAAPPTWSSVKVQGQSPRIPWTEPRITTGPDGTLWLVTNGDTRVGPAPPAGPDERTAPAIVMYSTDGGNTWHKTDTDPAGQVRATPDVDILTLPNGRVISTELDDAGINFPTAFSDDRGRTWT